jgi:hypothetical protein
MPQRQSAAKPNDLRIRITTRVQLFGRYIGQINVRVMCAWMRLRRPIGVPLFQCAVRIRHDRRRMVEDVVLHQFDDDTRWQRS